MCGLLCEAVVGEDAVNGADTLEQLERQNLFVVPLIAIAPWYRYHHLFAESLRHILHRTEPDHVLGISSSRRYEQQGYIAEAIQHAVAARSFEYAASLIEQEIQTNENLALMRSSCEMPGRTPRTNSYPSLAAGRKSVSSVHSSLNLQMRSLLSKQLPNQNNHVKLDGST